MSDTSRASRIIKRWETLRGEQSPWHRHWDDLSRVMLPRRYGFASTTIDGDRRTDDIFDGTPMQAARSLANAISGMNRPQGLPEIKIEVDDDKISSSEEAKVWLDDSARRLRKAFDNPKANFRQADGEKYLDIVVLGTASMFIGESANRTSLLFQTMHMRDIVAIFGEEGQPEALFHSRRVPLRWAQARFGEDALSEASRKKIKDGKIDDKITLLHVVQPRNNGRPNALFAKNLPIEDLWIEVEAKREVMQGGFHEFPFIVPRWDTTSGESYGRSPGMIALPDSDTLQAMGETILVAGQRAADPPLAVPNDGAFDAINTFPGGLAFYDVETASTVGRIPFQAIESGTNLPITRDMQLDTREQVQAAFFRNVFRLPVAGPQMTATEIIERKQEFIREMGPIFGRLESSDTAPMVERAFMVMLRAGGFAPIPQILSGQNIVFEYDSPVKRIREQLESESAKQWAIEMLELDQIKPGAADIINFDELGRFRAESLGVPKKIINSEEKVDQARQAQAQAFAEQNQRESLMQGAELAKTAGQAEAEFAKLTEEVAING